MSIFVIMVPAMLMVIIEGIFGKANEHHCFQRIWNKAKGIYELAFACMLCWSGKA